MSIRVPRDVNNGYSAPVAHSFGKHRGKENPDVDGHSSYTPKHLTDEDQVLLLIERGKRSGDAGIAWLMGEIAKGGDA